MRTIEIALLGILITLSFGCSKQDRPVQPLTLASELSWNGIFATRDTEKGVIYCLLGRGYFRGKSNPTADRDIHDWLIAHPKAQIVPMSLLATENTKMVWICVKDEGENLNSHLIQLGDFKSEAMSFPNNPADIDGRYWINGRPPGGDSSVTRLISVERYEEFLASIKQSEQSAKKNGLGLWAVGRQNSN